MFKTYWYTCIAFSPSILLCPSAYVCLSKTLLHRSEVYSTSNEVLERAVKYITSCDEAWVASAVVARKNTDGLFYQGQGKLGGQHLELK